MASGKRMKTTAEKSRQAMKTLENKRKAWDKHVYRNPSDKQAPGLIEAKEKRMLERKVK